MAEFSSENKRSPIKNARKVLLLYTGTDSPLKIISGLMKTKQMESIVGKQQSAGKEDGG